MQSFVPKARRAKFELKLRIHDLNNVPLVSGTSFIKWHLPSSTAAEHRGRTNKCQIREHKVTYDYSKTTTVRLTVGKDGMLQECAIDFEVLQEYSSGGRGERIRLGEVRLNLAEYVEASEAHSPIKEGFDEEGVVRRYLMQDSKINSTLKIGIFMRHIDGTRDYYAPPLRTAPVFGGIAGIIHSAEPGGGGSPSGFGGRNGDGTDGDGEGQDPSINLSSTNKEMGEMQDIYRRTLAAYWASQPGELRADEAIEDIFAGGDGWGKTGRPESSRGMAPSGIGDGNVTPQPDSGDPQVSHSRHREGDASSGSSHWHPGAVKQGAVVNRSSVAMRFNKRNKRFLNDTTRDTNELDEFEVRKDLKSWKIRESAYA